MTYANKRRPALTQRPLTLTLSLTLPIPPSANHIWRKYKNRVVLAPEVDVFRAEVWVAFQGWRAKNPCWTMRFPLKGRLSVSLTLVCPNRQHRDLDNLFKATLDALTHAKVWQDDSQVAELHATRAGIDADNPRLVVVVMPLDSPA